MNRSNSVPILKRSNLTTCLRTSPEKLMNSKTGPQFLKSLTLIPNSSKLDSQFSKYFDKRVYYSEIKQRPSNPIFSSKNKHEITHSLRRCVSYELRSSSISNLKLRRDAVVNSLLAKNSSRISSSSTSSSKKNKHKDSKVLTSIQPTEMISFQYKCYFRDFNLFSDVQGVNSYRSNTVPILFNPTDIKHHLPKFESFSSLHLVDIKEKRRRRMTCIRHLLQLKPTQHEIYHLKELMPGKPFSNSKANDFLRACKSGHVSLLKYFLVADKWIVHEYDNSGENGLHWACKRDNFEVLKLLLDAGCFVDSRDFAGRTPLYIAGRYNSMSCASILLNYEASMYISTYSGRNIFDIIRQSSMKTLVKRFKATNIKSNSAKIIQAKHRINTI